MNPTGSVEPGGPTGSVEPGGPISSLSARWGERQGEGGICRRYTPVLILLILLAGLGVFDHVAARAGGEQIEISNVSALVIAVSGMEGEPKTKFPNGGKTPIELTPVCGKPMISWVLEALRASRHVRDTIVVGDDKLRKAIEDKLENGEKFVTAGGRLSDRLLKGSESVEGVVLVVSPDLVLITPESVDNLVAECMQSQDIDIYYPVVKKNVCVSTYPWEKRTFARFRDGIYTGSHVLVFRAEFLKNNHDKVESMYLSRRSPLRMVRILGFRRTFRFIIGRLRLRHVVDAIEKKYDCRSKYIITDDVDLATDLSEPSEIEHIEKILRERAGGSAK